MSVVHLLYLLGSSYTRSHMRTTVVRPQGSDAATQGTAFAFSFFRRLLTKAFPKLLPQCLAPSPHPLSEVVSYIWNRIKLITSCIPT